MSVRRTLWLGLCLLMILEPTALAGPAEDGIKFFNSKNYKEARRSFEKAIPGSSSDSRLLYYYALTLKQTGSPAQARATFEKIVRDFPDSEAATYSRQALGLSPAARRVSSSQSSGSKTSSTTENADLNEKLPVYPGASDIKDNGSGCQFKANAGADQVVAYYTSELARRGWKVRLNQGSGSRFKEVTLLCSKGTAVSSVYVADEVGEHKTMTCAQVVLSKVQLRGPANSNYP
jgi:tetratricopeptide (TPR) repeat protein